MTSANPFADLQYEQYPIEKVDVEADGYVSVSFDGGWFVGLGHLDFTPKVDDLLTLWGERFRMIRGRAVNSRVIDYLTVDQLREKNAQEARQRRLDAASAYLVDKPVFDRRVAALPQVFQDRIHGFRDQNDDWGPDYEKYELFVCEEAIKMAAAFSDAEDFESFLALEWNAQENVLDQRGVDLDSGHSGNTYGCSKTLAHTYLRDSTLIPRTPGALCSLVGCQEYGCWAGRT